MSNPFDPSESRFVAGWDLNQHRVSGFWDPRKGEWFDYFPDKWRLVDPRLTAVDSLSLFSAGVAYPKVRNQWASYSAQHPALIWNPRDGEWRDPQWTGGKAEPPSHHDQGSGITIIIN